MGVLDMDGENGKVRVSNSMQMMAIFFSELTDESQLLEQMLLEDPSEFENLENRVHDIFNRGAGLFVAGILARVMQSEKHTQLPFETVKIGRFESLLVLGFLATQPLAIANQPKATKTIRIQFLASTSN
jgi:hypothetical protein